ncbi:hypothetical protein LTR70_005721 [Exophiala xenobiotica]|uniref:RING-type domain-containing protein n=1 Tax=Lithohypha guttulata TaxID=1690604 RepID=A0ABR0KE60_9EURO|nr:hypothetical protein LTR24_004104 [Lithohypha guttulata]KAK5317716.1 hypothetical protein LTR70_005721 [Exophiala xenobiotica]
MADDNQEPTGLNAAEEAALAVADLGAARYNFGGIQTATESDAPATALGENISPMADDEIPMGNTDATYMHIGCLNYFHSGCYERAIRESLNCPKCRAPIRSYGLYARLEEVEELSFAETVAPDMDAEVRINIALEDPENATPEQLLDLQQRSRPIIHDATEEYEINKDDLGYWTERKAKLVELGEAAFNNIPGYQAQNQYHKDCFNAMRQYQHKCLSCCTSFIESTQRILDHHVKPLIRQRYKAHFHIHFNASDQHKAQTEYQNNLITEHERDRLLAEHETRKSLAKQEYAQAREAIMQMAMKDCTDQRGYLHRDLRIAAAGFDDELGAARARMRETSRNTPAWDLWKLYPPDPRDTGLVEDRDTLNGRRLRNIEIHDTVQPILVPEEEIYADSMPYGPTLGGILLSENIPDDIGSRPSHLR